MPDPSTARLALYKSKSDGSELVTYPQDLGQNWDRVDAAVGAVACTSTTRPSTPWNGQIVRETNTGRVYVSNGSTPASGSWIEIATPGTAQTFTADLTISGGSALSIRTNTTDAAFRSRLPADTQNRFLVSAAGALTWGPGGSTAGDTNLYRGGANVLQTDDSLSVVGDLTVAGDLHSGSRTLGRGMIVSATVAQVSLSSTAEFVVATLPSTTLLSGRAYRLRVFGFAVASSAGYVYFRLRKGATTAGTLYVQNMRTPVNMDAALVANAPVLLDIPIVNSGSNLTTQMCLTAQVSSGTAQWSVGATTPAYVELYDVGLAADFAGVAVT